MDEVLVTTHEQIKRLTNEIETIKGFIKRSDLPATPEMKLAVVNRHNKLKELNDYLMSIENDKALKLIKEEV